MSDKVLIDTDIGEDIDDILAIAFALISPEFEVLGITTTDGDTHARGRIARKLALLCGCPNIPVAAGSMRSMPQADPESVGRGSVTQWDLAPDETGLPCPSDVRAAELIAQVARAHPGEVSLLTIGSMANAGQAVVRYPKAAGELKQVVTNGGVFGPGTETSIGWNLRYDPVAASIVARGPVPWVLLPENATATACLSPEDEERIRGSGHALGDLLSVAIDLWRQNKKDAGGRPPHLSDMNVFAFLMGSLSVSRAGVSITVTPQGTLPVLSLAHDLEGPHLTGGRPLDEEAGRRLRSLFLERIESWQPGNAVV